MLVGTTCGDGLLDTRTKQVVVCMVDGYYINTKRILWSLAVAAYESCNGNFIYFGDGLQSGVIHKMISGVGGEFYH